MEAYDLGLDLEALDFKSVTPSNNFKNISVHQTKTNVAPPYNNTSNDFMSSGVSDDKSFDLGLDLLINKKKARSDYTEINKMNNSSTNNSPTPRNNMNNIFNDTLNNNKYPDRVNIDDPELLQKSLFDDNITNIDLEKELSTMDLNNINKPDVYPSMSGPSLPTFNSSSTNANGTSNNNYNSSYNNNSGSGSGGGGGGGSFNNGSHMSFEEIQQKKFDLLCKFERLRDKGIKLPKTFSMSSSWEEMDMEYRRLVEHKQLDNSVKTQRRMLLSFVSGIEMLNNKFDPFELQLNGWSENINESLNDNEYDQIFEDLFYKYKDTINMAPELKLAGMIAMSGFWYHITQNMAKNFMPNIMNNVMKQNPDLMNQFQQATMNSVKQTNPNFANFANSMNTQQGPPKYNPMNAPPFSNPRDAPKRGQTNINQVDDIDALIDSIN